MAETILYLSHEDSLTSYENNSPDNFIVELDKQIILNEGSTVELLDFRCKLQDKVKGGRMACIECDICENSLVFGSYRPALHVFRMPTANFYSSDIYQPIKIKILDHKINRIGIHIRPLDRSNKPFDLEESCATLRIKHGSSN